MALWVNPRWVFFQGGGFKFLKHKLNFRNDVGRSHVYVRIGCAFVTTRPFSLRNNLVCRRCTNWANLSHLTKILGHCVANKKVNFID